jgi:hypothetical protein
MILQMMGAGVSMPQIETMEILGPPPEGALSRRAGGWYRRHQIAALSGALALAIAVIGVLGSWLYIDHLDTGSGAPWAGGVRSARYRVRSRRSATCGEVRGSRPEANAR